MKVVIQRVSGARVVVENKEIAKIGQGLLLLLGVGQEDDETTAARIAKKAAALRIFPDENGKTNRSIKDVDGSMLVVSQFTLYADTSHGNRPGFTGAANPEKGDALYEYFVKECKKYVENVQTGSFGADMKVELLNDGPFTILLE